MTAGYAFDILLCTLIVGMALGAVLGRDLFGAVALYVVYGLLLAIAWVRLGAVDVALAEAAIGAGLTGVLLLGAASRLEPKIIPGLRFNPAAALLCLAGACGLGWVVVSLAPDEVGLTEAVREKLPLSGAENPVTAVLINFRGWDTLVESVVLLVALVGVWALADDKRWGNRPGFVQRVRSDGVLAIFGRFLPPVGMVVGIYLIWVGTSAPGGAFQAGTVLAAVWLVAMLTAIARAPPTSRPWLRWTLVAGPMVFLLVGLLGFASGSFMAFDPEWAKTLVLTVEVALALSIAATLALLVIGPARTSE